MDTQGIDDAKIAITLNASYVEKHFTINNDLPGRDNKFALPNQLKEISEFININETNLNKNLDLLDGELDIYKNYRGRWSKIIEEIMNDKISVIIRTKIRIHRSCYSINFRSTIS